MIDIDTDLVRRLIASQFPQWAELSVQPVTPGGWDNRTFRLGNEMKVRLPSAESYVAQTKKEFDWLPKLAPLLPLPVPALLAMGLPAEGYPWPWSVYRWIEGHPATLERIADPCMFATSLAGFILALQRIDPTGGPAPGAHNFFRGGLLTIYDEGTRSALKILGDAVDAKDTAAVWDAALNATWSGPSVWVHGDVAAENLIIQNGQLNAVIDFGLLAVGDPACDLTIAWTLLEGEGRQAFKAAVQHDEATWARARGWALWKALITLPKHNSTSIEAAKLHRVIDAVTAEHKPGGP